MKDLIGFDFAQIPLEIKLWIAIGIFFLLIIGFLIATLTKRTIKLRLQTKRESYLQEIEGYLFQLLFADISLAKAVSIYNSKKRSALYRETLYQAMYSLHKTYTGDQRKLIEDFFLETGMATLSRRKLKSRNVDIILEGIRELSRMRVTDATNSIVELLKHSDNSISKEALVALVILHGTPVFALIPLPVFELDDWTQSRILFHLKIAPDDGNPDLAILLESDNESLILLGARLLWLFKRFKYEEIIRSKLPYIKSSIVRNQLEQVLMQFTRPQSA